MDYVSDINGIALLEIRVHGQNLSYIIRRLLLKRVPGTSISLLLQFHSYNISAHNP